MFLKTLSTTLLLTKQKQELRVVFKQLLELVIYLFHHPKAAYVIELEDER